jgi:phage shock protein C
MNIGGSDGGGSNGRSWSDDWARQERRLHLDPVRRRIAGVCAGIARYYAVEPWVVRLIAVTGLLFFPGIVFPAYWVAYFVMERAPRAGGDPGRHRWSHGRRFRSRRDRPRDQFSSPAPELGPRFSPRYSLRDVKADLTEVELRLRRMETHVTSGRYELQRELHKIDPGTAR